jgi:hypothetical protein
MFSRLPCQTDLPIYQGVDGDSFPSNLANGGNVESVLPTGGTFWYELFSGHCEIPLLDGDEAFHGK